MKNDWAFVEINSKPDRSCFTNHDLNLNTEGKQLVCSMINKAMNFFLIQNTVAVEGNGCY